MYAPCCQWMYLGVVSSVLSHVKRIYWLSLKAQQASRRARHVVTRVISCIAGVCANHGIFRYSANLYGL